MAIQLGQGAVLKVDTTGSPTYTEVGGQRSLTFNRTQDAVDTTTKSSDLDKECMGGERDSEITVEGIVDQTDAALIVLESAEEDGTVCDCRIEDAAYTYTFDAIVTSFNIDAPKDNVYAYTCTLKRTGTTTKAAV